MNLNPQLLKDTFTRYATGVTVVSCPAKGAYTEPLGITVNSFVSVSLEPPLVSWCIDRQSSVFDRYYGASHYAVSILTAEQQEISQRFATPGNHAFKEGEFELWDQACPILKTRIAAMECKVVARHDAGDHVILLGQIERAEFSEGQPLIYVNRTYMQGPEIK